MGANTELKGIMGAIDLLEEQGVDVNQYINERGFDATKMLNDLRNYNFINGEELKKIKSPF